MLSLPSFRSSLRPLWLLLSLLNLRSLKLSLLLLILLMLLNLRPLLISYSSRQEPSVTAGGSLFFPLTPAFAVVLGYLQMIPQGLLVRRSPGYLPAVGQLDAVFDPGGLALCSSVSHSPLGLRHIGKDRHAPKIWLFSGLCVRFRATPFTSLLSLIFLSGLRL